jgi:hypothetical protein
VTTLASGFSVRPIARPDDLVVTDRDEIAALLRGDMEVSSPFGEEAPDLSGPG